MKLPRLFSPGMVVQQGMPIPVWGWSAPLQRVQVTLGGKTGETQADAKGMWMVKIPKLQGRDFQGASLTMSIQGDSEVRVEDVVVGEVWLCAGEAAMHLPLERAGGVASDLAKAQHPLLRLFTVAQAGAPRPLSDVQPEAHWQRCTPQRAASFSAVAYFFGRELLRALDVPVGLIQATWPGTMAEAWTSRAALASEGVLSAILKRGETAGALPAPDSADFKRQLKSWQEKHVLRDTGNKGSRRNWHKPTCADERWPTLSLPGPWQDQGLAGHGAVWLRRRITLPKEWRGKAVTLSLGPIADFDTTYLNGTEVGSTSSPADGARDQARLYQIPGRLVKAGDNLIAIRVFNRSGAGGLLGEPDQLWLGLRETGKSTRLTKTTSAKRVRTPKKLALGGAWSYQIETQLSGPSKAVPQPLHHAHHDVPATISNAMIQPLVPYGLRGAVWYQGESNLDRAFQYRTLLPTMIKDWRLAWGQGDFHFGIVQLPARRSRADQVGDSAWAELREAQALACALPRIGLALSADLPLNGAAFPCERDVGARLGSWARSEAYQQVGAWRGPRYLAMETRGANVRLRFEHAEGGLAAAGGRELRGFAIAGNDGRFHIASAIIEADTVIVSSPAVPAPVAVRYAWADMPEGNLRNAAGLPAAAFRSDTWEISTQHQR